MNIFLVSNMFPSQSDGRYGVFVKKLHDRLHSQGWNTKLAAVIPGRSFGVFPKLLAYFRFYAAIFAYGLFGRYDLIWLHFPPYAILPVALVAWIRRKPVIVNYHGSDLMRRGWVRDTLNRFACRRAEVLVCPSRFFSNEIECRYGSRHVVTFPSCGVDAKRFSPTKSAHRTNTRFTIGFISHLIDGKGGLEFIQALGLIEDLQFQSIMVGSGPERLRVQQEIDGLRLNDRVEVLDQKSHFELPEVFRKFDVFVFPTKLPESLGLVAIEALACGVPVIAPRAAAIPEYIQDRVNGLLLDDVTPENIASSLRVIFSNRDDWADREPEISQSVDRYNQSVVIDNLVNELSAHFFDSPRESNSRMEERSAA